MGNEAVRSPVIKGRSIGQTCGSICKNEGAIKCIVRYRVAAQSRGPFVVNNGLGKLRNNSLFSWKHQGFLWAHSMVLQALDRIYCVKNFAMWNIIMNFGTILIGSARFDETFNEFGKYTFMTIVINLCDNEKYNETGSFRFFSEISWFLFTYLVTWIAYYNYHNANYCD